tara:strand:- start:756 stop:965 length:210 start_codon:yes stop_codon:yes gene_type:complete
MNNLQSVLYIGSLNFVHPREGGGPGRRKPGKKGSREGGERRKKVRRFANVGGVWGSIPHIGISYSFLDN